MQRIGRPLPHHEDPASRQPAQQQYTVAGDEQRQPPNAYHNYGDSTEEEVEEEETKPLEPSPATQQRAAITKSYVSNYYGKLADRAGFIRDHTQVRRRRMAISDYELLTVIGRGAFGEVRLCRERSKPAAPIRALKILNKHSMVNRNQVQHVRSERNIMVEARARQESGASTWVVNLYDSFQDREFLYIVMEYCPGGDMMRWLMHYDIFEESVARFYTAELVLAVHSLHKMNWAHRDLKPDNILLDRHGHIKLSDFGLCKRTVDDVPLPSGGDSSDHLSGSESDRALSSRSSKFSSMTPRQKRESWKQQRQREMFYTTVGSPGYIAPEVLAKTGYGMECDWWSVGIILYEMLCGYPPFYGDDNNHTGQKIIRWQQHLEFPDGMDAISPEAEDIIRGMVCGAESRMGFESIVNHRFFKGIDWAAIRSQTAPFRIELSSNTDTRYFDEITEAAPRAHVGQGKLSTEHQYLFYGFTSKFTGNTSQQPPRGVDQETEKSDSSIVRAAAAGREGLKPLDDISRHSSTSQSQFKTPATPSDTRSEAASPLKVIVSAANVSTVDAREEQVRQSQSAGSPPGRIKTELGSPMDSELANAQVLQEPVVKRQARPTIPFYK